MQSGETTPVRVLLIARDQDVLARVKASLGRGGKGGGYDVRWSPRLDRAVSLLSSEHQDVCLLDADTVGASASEVGGTDAESGLGDEEGEPWRVPCILLTREEGDGGTEWVPGHLRGAERLPWAAVDGPLLVQAVRHALERRRALDAARAHGRQFRAVFGGALDAMLIVDDDGRYIDGNPAALELLGLDLEQLRRVSISDVSVVSDARELAAMWSSFQQVGKMEGEMVLRRADGELRTAEFRATASIMPGRHLAVMRDVTERRAAEERLAIADRMAAVGALAAGVAHEINNPLTAVTANLELSLRELRALEGPPSDAARRKIVGVLQGQLEDAHAASARIASIVRDIKLFSRATEDEVAAIDVHRVLETTLRMASNELRHRARVVRRYEEVPAVLVNESRLGQVFLNLIINAAQAIPDGHADEHEVRISSWLDEARRMVIVEVTDSGIGMSRETLGKLFTPFFTTKPTGVGTGLGLAISQRLVAAVGGEITVTSELGRGTTARVALPAARPDDGDLSRSASEPAAEVRPEARARLLVVDDEESICTTLAYFFASEHEVQTTTSAVDALERIRSGEHYDLILCDVMMPVMTGMELHEALSEVNPAMAARMVFLTGGAFTPRMREFLERMRNDYVEKPYSLKALRTLVNAKLAGQR